MAHTAIAAPGNGYFLSSGISVTVALVDSGVL
jgi:hypothetical protein